jgi:hypothetical protein
MIELQKVRNDIEHFDRNYGEVNKMQ